MKKILLVFIGIILYSSTSFGQNLFKFKPHTFGMAQLPKFPVLSGFAWIQNPLPKPGAQVIAGNELLMANINRFRQIDDIKMPLPEKVTMPIIDLSKGLSSNLPIKKFPADYPSNMPIIGGKTQILPEGLNEGDAPIIIPDARKP
ncbi:MAG: hypothetical protein R6V72_22650 [Cyclobacterium sp.]|uniref:hypothetical protein n=1 Tax=unclassified Cyclobacterium TaxID=2615055 RepID=UPI0013D079EC|nr:hypothetical protein [Cyclobacterium sp. SYSU L10401]